MPLATRGLTSTQQHLQLHHEYFKKLIGVILQEYFFLTPDAFLSILSPLMNLIVYGAHHLPCFFFLLGTPTPEGSTNGPDQVWIFALGCEKFVELNGTSGGSKTGSM